MAFECDNCMSLPISGNAETYREAYRFEARQSSVLCSKMLEMLNIIVALIAHYVYYWH